MASQTLTLSSPDTSPAALALTSPAITPWPARASRSNTQSRSTSRFRLASPVPIPTTPEPEQHLVSERDILTSPLIPAFPKPTLLKRHRRLRDVLSTHDRRGCGFHATGATVADRLAAAEQLARMTMVFEWYVDFFSKQKKDTETGEGDDDKECESLATELLDASLCASGRRGTFEQPCFITPMCLMGKESEVAELTARCLQTFERSRSSRTQQEPPRSAAGIQGFWNRSYDAAQQSPITCATKPYRGLASDIDWLPLALPGEGRFRAENDSLHAADVRSARHEDLDHSVWKEGPDAVETSQPLAESTTLLHTPQTKGIVWRGRKYQVTSRFVRAALHPWCLRCYRMRRSLRGSSKPDRVWGLLDLLFMLLRMWIELAVEGYIAWCDDGIATDLPFTAKAAKAWSVFLEAEVQGGAVYWREKKMQPEGKPRHRSISCPF